MAEQTRTFGYICPSCGKAVLADRTRFALSAAAVGSGALFLYFLSLELF